MPSYPQESPDLESSTEAYARRFNGPVGQYFLEVQSSNVLALMPPAEGCSVLDVGGGHGQLVLPLVEAGYDVTVVGSDDAFVSRLDRIVGPDRYQYLCGNLLELPCERDSYDVVLGFRLLPHLENWSRFLGELCRVARRCLIVDYPDVCSVNVLSSLTLGVKRGVEKNTRPYRCFRRSEIVAELRRNHFQQDSFRGQFFFPMALHRLMQVASMTKSLESFARLCGLTRCFGSPVILRAAPMLPAELTSSPHLSLT